MKRIRMLYAVVIAGLIAVALAGCDLELTGIELGDEFVDYLLGGAIVADVQCDPAASDGLEIATQEAGNCMAFNADGTRIALDNNPVVRWRSTNPDAVAVAMDGKVYAASVVDTVWVVASGAKRPDGTRSADSVQVWSY